MHDNLNILMAQINPVVGALAANRDKILDVINKNQHSHDVIVFPELALTGYPPEDLLYKTEFRLASMACLAEIQAQVKDCYVLIGKPTWMGDERCYNSASLLHQGAVSVCYHKQKLPNYEVFDESRYFVAGPRSPRVVTIKNHKIGICICEDLWQPGPVEDLIQAGAELILSPNASPFDHSKYARREALLRAYAKSGLGIIYVNQVGGQDEILFDGQSLAMDKNGGICGRAPAFEEALCSIQYQPSGTMVGEVTPLLSKEALIYQALVCGTRDYVLKNNFPGVLLGLSGGIDSALTLAIAVDALGADKVQAVMMPSRYSAKQSRDDALKQLEILGVSHSTLSIEPMFQAALSTLEPEFQGLSQDTTEENIQARIRGLLLMALSNKTGKMVLTTSNKSEVAVGYSTLYGDMAGGFAVLKDVLKTEVYALAHYRNSISQAIPNSVIERAPSAELRHNQKDQDSLPEYAVLDAIIEALVVDNLSIEMVISQGFSQEVVIRVARLIQGSEYKRAQSAPGIKISPIAFGKDWRFPITNGYMQK